YYLSQFAQGRWEWLRGQDLYTSEFTMSTFVGWTNVLLGRIGFLIGLPHWASYHLAVVAFTALFLVLSFKLIQTILPDQPLAQTMSMTLFVLSSPLPAAIDPRNVLAIRPFDYWYNLGNPWNRFGGVPHQLLGNIAIAIIFFTALGRPTSTGKKKLIAWGILIVSGLVLGSIQPIQWGMVAVALGMTTLVIRPVRAANFLGVVLVGLGGALPVWYLSKLFSAPPYGLLRVWEATQQVRPGFIDFVMAGGPVVIVALGGLIGVAKHLTPAKLLILVYTLATTALFFSPVPTRLALGNVRFLSSVTFLGYAAIAGSFIPLVPAKLMRIVLGAVVGLLLISFTTWPALLGERVSYNTNNAYFYLHQGVTAFLQDVQQKTTPQDTILAVWPFNVSIPGLIGRRVFNGHPLLTIDATNKDKTAASLFDGKLSDQEIATFIKTYRITHILAYRFTPNLATLPYLTTVINGDYLVLYRVRQKAE
ncbi:hypothetical protein HY087_02560, partial [Candidatus Gottesmanbacteria bacterium]|nr:hypothetical protein [Candidatus Gottesmanbacteria bacterium]